jgi:hypothetical protein
VDSVKQRPRYISPPQVSGADPLSHTAFHDLPAPRSHAEMIGDPNGQEPHHHDDRIPPIYGLAFAFGVSALAYYGLYQLVMTALNLLA